MERARDALARISRKDFLIGIVLAVGVFAFVVLGAAAEQQAQETQLTVVCTSARANVSQLEALAAISHRLGIPVDFEIPEVPAECDGR